MGGADIEWVLDGIFAEGALHMLTSDPGAGKSTLVASVGYAVSLGWEFLGRATSKRPVLILDAENPSSARAILRPRSRATRAHTGLTHLLWCRASTWLTSGTRANSRARCSMACCASCSHTTDSVPSASGILGLIVSRLFHGGYGAPAPSYKAKRNRSRYWLLSGTLDSSVGASSHNFWRDGTR